MHMFNSFDNRVTLKGKLTAMTALRVGAGRATGVRGTDLPVVRDAMDNPYIPGSSFKGAMRAAIESLLRSVAVTREEMRRVACNPINKDEWCLDAAQGANVSDADVEEKTCLVCRVFGSPWLASKVNIRDLLIDGVWFGQYEIRNGVAIERDTGAAADKKLYDFEVVPAGTSFSCEIVVENASEWELGLFMFGLRPFELGEATLGGARSRGLGVVKLDLESRTQVEKGKLLDYLAGEPSALTAITDQDVDGWKRSFRGKLGEVAHA